MELDNCGQCGKTVEKTTLDNCYLCGTEICPKCVDYGDAGFPVCQGCYDNKEGEFEDDGDKYW